MSVRVRKCTARAGTVVRQPLVGAAFVCLAWTCLQPFGCGDDQDADGSRTDGGELCTDGDTKLADEGCNSCVCDGGRWKCTLRGCNTCPDPVMYDGACDTVVVYARDPVSGRCCQYGTPCGVPEGWEQFYSLNECEGSTPTGPRWYTTCGAPVCGPDTEVPAGTGPCTDQVEGDACQDEGGMCDPGRGCGVTLICAASDPKMETGGCPISRAHFKRDIHYLSRQERALLARQILQLPLATWRYHGSDGERHLGFILEDVEPSPSVDGPRDRVNLYGYTSMTVAALQEQARELEALQAELVALREAVRQCR